MRNSFDPSALIRLRKAAKLTQAQLAERVSVATWTVGSWELGRQTPEAKRLPGLAAALDVEVDELLGTAPPTPRVFRHRLGLTQVELAELMGIASGVVAEVELGLYVGYGPGICSIAQRRAVRHAGTARRWDVHR